MIVKLFPIRLLDVTFVAGTDGITVAELTALSILVVITKSFAAVIPGVFPTGVSADVSIVDCEITPFTIIVLVTGLGIVTFAPFKIADTTVVNEFIVTVFKVVLGIVVSMDVILTTMLAAANASISASTAIIAGESELIIFVVIGTSVFVAKVEGT